jgi:hypothetical protein
MSQDEERKTLEAQLQEAETEKESYNNQRLYFMTVINAHHSGEDPLPPGGLDQFLRQSTQNSELWEQKREQVERLRQQIATLRLAGAGDEGTK